jgi:hypothetical protein
MEKIEINVNLSNSTESTKFLINSNSYLDKLFKIIELYFEMLQDKQYNLLYNEINLKDYNLQAKLSDIFKNVKVIDLTIDYLTQGNSSILEFECNFKNKTKNFKISNQLPFLRLKYKLLSIFPELEVESYQIMYLNNDITNYYGDEKLLSEIFSKFTNEIFKISINIKPKHIVEYYKRCSFCIENKAVAICNKCAICNCEDCSSKDSHVLSRGENFIKLHNFKDYETTTLENYLNSLKHSESENESLNSKNFSSLMKEKIFLIEKKFTDMIENLNVIKNLQINNLKTYIDSIKSKNKPENIDEILKNLHEIIIKYKLNPFYDCEESMRKILEFENSVKIFNSDFENYKFNLNDLHTKFTSCQVVNSNLSNNIKNCLTETQAIFKQTKKENNENKFYPVMKVYDNKSIIIFDQNTEEFSIMNFIDVENKFKENFNNYVQYNYIEENRLFIITGSPCQKLFCYNYQTNEMEYINTLKFSHNWWPAIIVTPNFDKSQISKINLFCLSGTYTNKCEQLSFNLKNKKIEKDLELIWKDIPSLNLAHGQASAFVLNHVTIYVLFGYDYNFNSIATVERWTINEEGYDSNSKWEIINFKNPDSISSILYYHANFKFDEERVYILGGLKEINECDVVYNFEIQEANLKKTEFKFDFLNIKFCFEKNFVLLNKAEREYGNTSGQILLENQAKLFDSLQDTKDFNATINFKKLQNDKASINNSDKNDNDKIFALFDSKNNIHLIKPTTFEYRVKYFENK